MSRTGRTAVVTGSGSGLGAAIRVRLEADGHRVVGVDLTGQEVSADLSEPVGRGRAAEAVAAEVDAVDALVVCAGLGPQVAPTSNIVAVNYFGAVHLLDALLPSLQRGDRPAALAVASNSLGLIPADDALVAACLDDDEDRALARAEELDGSTCYGNSKLALARAVRRRVQPWGEAGVRLCAIAPGPIETPLLQGTRDDPVLGPHVDALPIPLGRTAQPAEIAGIAAFLLSDDAALVHGAVLFADGGTDALLRPDAT